MVSEWRSVIAVSLNVGGGVRLIKPAKLCMCTQKHYKHNEAGRTAPGVCGNGSVPLSHSRSVVTRIGIRTHTYAPGVYLVACERGYHESCFGDYADQKILKTSLSIFYFYYFFHLANLTSNLCSFVIPLTNK